MLSWASRISGSSVSDPRRLPVSNILNLVSLSVFTIALAVGQLLFKQVGLAVRGKPLGEAALTLAQAPALYAALALYGATTFLWIWILTRVPLMQAYPWVAAGVILVPLLSGYFFGERVAPVFWLGAGLIAVGLLLTQYAAE